MTDPATGAVIWQVWAGLGAAAGAAAGSALSEDADVPEIKAPEAAPELPESPTQAKAPGTDKTKAEFNSQRARDDERRRAASRQGRSNTILTGSLGVSSPAQTSRKTLLGE